MSLSDIPKEVLDEYVLIRVLPDERICGVHRLVYHWTVHIDIDPVGYRERYCFRDFVDAAMALAEWDGRGDMPGRWHKHPNSGRRRDPDTGEIWHESDDFQRSQAALARKTAPAAPDSAGTAPLP